MKRIFPFVDNTWINYSNYLAWLDMNIESLKDYLLYFNSDYKVLNESLPYINSSNWLEETTSATSTHNDVFYNLSITDNEGKLEEKVKVCFPYQLNWREGIFNPYSNSYACLKPNIVSPSDGQYTITRDSFNIALKNNDLKHINISNTIISKKWTHSGLQNDDNNKEKFYWNNYVEIAKSQPNIYSVSTTNKSIKFEIIDSINSSFISNYSFSLEILPNRYIISDISSKWNKGSNAWSITGAIWNTPQSSLIPQVYTKTNSIWTNNYPLLHELYIKNNDWNEQFFCDDLCSTNSINIALHNTAQYTIKINTEDPEYTLNWDNVYVKII